MPLPRGFRFIPFVGIVSLPALWQASPRTTAVVDLTIGGGSETRDDYSFVAISGLAFDAKRRIIVTDLRDHIVRIYDSSGAFTYAVGRQGAGPGEFTFPVSATFDREGLLWIRDDGNRRFNAYELGSTRATFRTSVRYEHPPSVNRIEPIGFDHAGRIVSIGTVRGPERASTPARFYIEPGGTVVRVDTIATPPAESVGTRAVSVKASAPGVSVPSTVYYYQPFGPSFLVAHSPTGEWARIVTSRYDVEWFSADGRRLRWIRQDMEGPPLSAAERQRGEATVREFLATARVPASSIPGLPRRKTQSHASRSIPMGISGWNDLCVTAQPVRQTSTIRRDVSSQLSLGRARSTYSAGSSLQSLDPMFSVSRATRSGLNVWSAYDGVDVLGRIHEICRAG